MRRYSFRLLTCPVSLAMLALPGVAGAATIRGTVLDSRQQPLVNAAVWVMDTAAWPRIRALTDANGEFKLDMPAPAGVLPRKLGGAQGLVLGRKGTVAIEVRSLDGHIWRHREIVTQAGTWRVANPKALLSGLPKGTWIVELRAGTSRWTETQVSLGASSGQPRLEAVTSLAVGARVANLENPGELLVRKAGFEPLRMDLPVTDTTLSLVLATGAYEARIDSVLKTMDQADKFGQMTQGLITSPIKGSRLGSVLSGGGEPVAGYDELQAQTELTARRIPLLYGIDAVHGHAKWEGATVFPHNIGLGATRDTSLLRRMGEVTAKELWAGNVDWAFAPCIAVARDERWGRTYEAFGEVPELAARLGAAYVKGMQGDAVSTPWRVVACAKHYLGDGGTTFGTGAGTGKILNEGDAQITQAELDSIHLPGYIASVAVGVSTVMASYSSFNGVKMHGNKALMTDTLKTNFAFDGFVVSDWAAIGRIGTTPYKDKVELAVNAGMDMAMEPAGYSDFILALTDLVKAGKISQARIDDAVRRILRVKFRQGLFESSARRNTWDAELGSEAHRAVAREAVRKSLVLLKNEGGVLPLSKAGKPIAVVGRSADNPGLQCGGWTKVDGNDAGAWNGASGPVAGATSIFEGMQAAAGGLVQGSTTGAGVVVVVTGELPYAETNGDQPDLPLPPEVATMLAAAKKAGQKTVLVLISGRPLILGAVAANADAIVAGWLPGSEGAGVADILFGDYAPTGKLPCSWPSQLSQIPINLGDGKVPLYPYGYGLTW